MEIGTSIKHYLVLKHIGRGGMGDVWAARDIRLNRMVAIKTIVRNLADETDYLSRFKEEAQTIAELEHPHILPIYDFGDIDNQLYIVMRYVSGGTLFDRLVDGPLPPDEVLRVGRALASALDYAHASNIVHLDLKPLNVLIDAQNLPYLADFGLAMRVGSGTMTLGTASGSIGYMAPEQVTGGTLAPQTDVFSFAVMLYHLFTGGLPFGEGTLTALQIIAGQLLPDPGEKVTGLPYEMSNILRHATTISIEDRVESASALVEMLVEVVEGTPDDLLTFDMSDLDFNLGGAADPDSLARMEAQDIFFRATHAWGQGKGQFVLGMADYMLTNCYYQPGGELSDEIDDADKQMMLRGAIEYNQEIALWQAQISDQDAQREVCLHVLRSGLPAARARAIKLLAGLPDADPPVIVRKVVRDLGVESDVEVRSAAIVLMAARGGTPSEWRPAAYTAAIDERLAEEALRTDAPAVAEQAARTLGRLRSTAGVKFLAAQGAIDALALVRDEAPNLPAELSGQQRARVYATLTQHKLREGSMSWRFITAAAGGMLGMGGFIFVTYCYHQPLMLLKRLLQTIGVGVPFGLLIGLMVLLTVEVPERLHKPCAWWARVPLSWALGTAAIAPAFVYYIQGYLNLDPTWTVLLTGSAALAGVLVLGGTLRLPVWGRVLLAMVGISAVPLLTHHQYLDGAIRDPLLYFGSNTQAQLLSLLLGVTVALGAYLPDIPYGRLGLAGGLLVLTGETLISLAAALLGKPSDAPGLLLAGMAAIATFALSGVAVAVLARDEAAPRAVGLSVLVGTAVYSLLHFIIFSPPVYPLPPDLSGTAIGLYLAKAVGGPLLAGALAFWVRCRRKAALSI